MLHAGDVRERNLQPAPQRPEPIETFDLEHDAIPDDGDLNHVGILLTSVSESGQQTRDDTRSIAPPDRLWVEPVRPLYLLGDRTWGGCDHGRR